MRIKYIYIVILFITFISTILQAQTNTPPIITNISPLSPITVVSGSTYQISYFINDNETTNYLYVYLYYNTNKSIIGATIIDTIAQTPGTNIYNWDTTGVSSGTYWIIGTVTDGTDASALTSTNYSAATITISNTNTAGPSNTPPIITNISPLSNITVVSGSTYQISCFIYDNEDSSLQVNLYYNTNKTITGAIPICITNWFVGTNWYYNWDTTGVLCGTYWIIGKVTDSSNASATNYSIGTITISNTNTVGPSNTPPIITNISPLSNITVASGSIYQISYFINDNEDSFLLVNLYYNTNKTITGAIPIYMTNWPAGTNGWYNWDTTGVLCGTYWIIGKVTDSSNASATNYSLGTITISNTNTAGPSNTPPIITNISPLSPITVASGSTYQISYFINDNETTNYLYVYLYYNTNKSITGATIIDTKSQTPGTNIYNWDTTGVSSGTYWIIGTVTDGTDASALTSTNYSAATITISNTNTVGPSNTQPIITNISPNSLTFIPSGWIYTISYYITDNEDSNLSVKLYYNTSKTIAGATLIGSTNQLVGTNFYNWDTKNVPNGIYWIIGKVTDSSNATDISYSSARIVISNTNVIQDTTSPAVPTGIKIYPGDKQLLLTWQMNIEPDLKGYYIYRKSEFENEYSRIQLVEMTNCYVDMNLQNGTVYYYRLSAVDINGNESGLSAVVSGMPFSPSVASNNVVLSDNKITPNDENQEVMINVTPQKAKYAGKVDIYIYDVAMKLIKKIEINNVSENEMKLVKWNLRNENNVKVPTGIYFIYIVGKNWKTVKTVYVIR